MKTYRFGVFFNLKRSNENSLIKTLISPLQFELWSEQMCIDLSLEITSCARPLAFSCLSFRFCINDICFLVRQDKWWQRTYACCLHVLKTCTYHNEQTRSERERKKEQNAMNNQEEEGKGQEHIFDHSWSSCLTLVSINFDLVFGRLWSFFHFIRRFWNQIWHGAVWRGHRSRSNLLSLVVRWGSARERFRCVVVDSSISCNETPSLIPGFDYGCRPCGLVCTFRCHRYSEWNSSRAISSSTDRSHWLRSVHDWISMIYIEATLDERD